MRCLSPPSVSAAHRDAPDAVSDLSREVLPPDLAARLERVQLSVRRPLAGHGVGGHRSPRKGASLDFADHRPYVSGDDVRRIDANLSARLDHLIVKLFEAEDDLTVRLLIDTSASMGPGGKLDHAVRLAAAIGFVALVRRDMVRVHTIGRQTPVSFSGRGSAAALVQHLASLRATGPSPLASAVSDVLGRPGPPGTMVLLSDLMTPEWDAAIRRLPARRGDGVVVQVLHPDELDPVLAGDLELRDAETGVRMPVSLDESVRRAYAQRAKAWSDEVAGAAKRCGLGFARTLVGDDIEDTLLRGWTAAGILR